MKHGDWSVDVVAGRNSTRAVRFGSSLMCSAMQLRMFCFDIRPIDYECDPLVTGC